MFKIVIFLCILSVAKMEKSKNENFDVMTLQKFRLWSMSALQLFLSLRNKKADGTFDELAARSFVTYEENISVDAKRETVERQSLIDYTSKLALTPTFTIPDPFTISDGWLNESNMSEWPAIHMHDITEFLRLKTPAEIYERVMNEYKQGKAYRYYTAGWVKEIHLPPIDDHSSVGTLACKVIATMRLNMPPYYVWVAAKTPVE